MAITKTKIKFSIPLKKWGEKIFDNVVEEQTKLLIAYAEKNIILIGDRIREYDSKNNMDDKGNLLDSLCWGVCYDGSLKASGFYREKTATEDTYIHGFTEVAVLEGGTRSKWKSLYNKDVKKARDLQRSNWSYVSAGTPINGRSRAEKYIEKASKQCGAGQWTVFFAILAPYWGYWEEGHQNVLTGRFEQFSVMTQFYDKIKPELKPAKTRIHVYVDRYASKSLYAQAKRNLRQANKQ